MIPGLPLLEFPPIKFNYSFWSLLSGSAPYSLAFVSSLALKIYWENEYNKNLAHQMSIQRAQTEIQHLRSQINPHFLFNALNNIHHLILKHPKTAAKYTVLLSELLRYMLYEVKKNKTTLKNEVQSLENYLELIEIKMEDPRCKSISIQVEDDQLQIPPLLLINLVENGIKHSGVEYSDRAYLELYINETDQLLTIKMKNSIFLSVNLDINRGIGMENLKKRLQLNYPERHTFSFLTQNDAAETILTINLKS